MLGIAPGRSGFLDVTDEDWDRTLDANLLVMARSCRAALRSNVISPGPTRTPGFVSNFSRDVPPACGSDYRVDGGAVRGV